MKRMIIGLTSLAIGLGALGLPATTASAAAKAPPESGLQCVHQEVNSCWAHQVVFRGDPMLEFRTWTKATWPNGYNYHTDGCSIQVVRDWLDDHSIPFEDLVRAALEHFSEIFRPACLIHDFGYRNFGTGKQAGFKQYSVSEQFLTQNQLSWGETTDKGYIDHRFGDLMHRICDDRDEGTLCNAGASAFELAVSAKGHIDP